MVATSAMAMIGGSIMSHAAAKTISKKDAMSITLPELPYAQDALEPVISMNTLSFHHGKHHKAYVDKTNELIQSTPLEGKELEEVIKTAASNPAQKVLFNNAAQVWNHTFYWNSMKPGGGGVPQGELAKLIERDFGSFDAFKKEFKQAGATQFGSGWAWLVLDGDKLKITRTANADLPLVHNQKALLTADVWEHAYYLDFQNRRPDYLTAFLDKLVNWEFVEKNLTA
jgi:Fe-Mn family superoxide dismutase